MTTDFQEQYEQTSEQVLTELRTTLGSVNPTELERLADEILNAEQVFFVGVGRVMLALQCVCKRLAHLGVRAHYVGRVPAFNFWA